MHTKNTLTYKAGVRLTALLTTLCLLLGNPQNPDTQLLTTMEGA